MSTPSREPQQPLTDADVKQWLFTMDGRRFALYPKLVGTPAQVEVFWEMADLLQEAIEEVRTISAELWEGSQHICGKSAALRARSAQLLERSERCTGRKALPDGQAAEVRGVESRLLDMFRGDRFPVKKTS
jgi:hypothetical protein